MTQNIEKFLRHFTDQCLANLQCAAEDDTLIHWRFNACLLHHHQGNYLHTKHYTPFSDVAQAAELEYFNLGITESQRNQALLPLIKAEWTIREDIAKCKSTLTCSESSTK